MQNVNIRHITSSSKIAQSAVKAADRIIAGGNDPENNCALAIMEEAFVECLNALRETLGIPQDKGSRDLVQAARDIVRDRLLRHLSDISEQIIDSLED